jgi:hypothetical protein
MYQKQIWPNDQGAFETRGVGSNAETNRSSEAKRDIRTKQHLMERSLARGTCYGWGYTTCFRHNQRP